MKYQRVIVYGDAVEVLTNHRYSVKEILAFRDRNDEFALEVVQVGDVYKMRDAHNTLPTTHLFIPESHPWFNIGLVDQYCWKFKTRITGHPFRELVKLAIIMEGGSQ